MIFHEDIWKIFYPLYFDIVAKMRDDTYFVITELLNEGILLLEMEKTDSNPDIEPAPPKRDTFKHQKLKGLGAYLLKSLGETKVSFEYKRYDVYGHDLKIRIECGHTKGIRLLESILNPPENDNQFWVLQYYNVPNLGNCNLFKFKFNQNKTREFKEHRHKHIKRMENYKQEYGHYPEFWNPAFGVVKYPLEPPEESLRKQFE